MGSDLDRVVWKIRTGFCTETELEVETVRYEFGIAQIADGVLIHPLLRIGEVAHYSQRVHLNYCLENILMLLNPFRTEHLRSLQDARNDQ